jgi:hypothetical protein
MVAAVVVVVKHVSLAKRGPRNRLLRPRGSLRAGSSRRKSGASCIVISIKPTASCMAAHVAKSESPTPGAQYENNL